MSSFFRVLIGDWTTKLSIPRLFVSSFITSFMPMTVILSSSSSERQWMVEIEEDEEDKTDICFKRGWPKFVEDNTLDNGYFLVFKFDGNSKFKVTIFGKSTCEKTLEIARAQAQQQAQINQNLNEQRCHNKRAPPSPARDSTDGKIKDETLDLDGDDDDEEEEEDDDDDDDTSSSQEMWDETWAYHSEEDDEDEEEEEGDDEPDDDSAMDIGEGENLLGPMVPSFSIHLQPAYAKKGCMCFPTEFFHEHMKNKRQEVEIETIDGVWTVTLLPHMKRTRTFARFSKGWSEFAKANRFKTGETLVFKMVRTGDRPKFIVHRQPY